MRPARRSTIIPFTLLLCLVLSVAAYATDLTVFVVSDTHFTGDAVPSNVCKAGIQAMNSLQGTPYPHDVGGGNVSVPSAVIVCGDLCDGGSPKKLPASDNPQWYCTSNYQDQWNGFDCYFPANGISGDNNRLKYPTYATGGNHDWWRYGGTKLGTSTYVANKLKERYCSICNTTEGNVYYSFNMDGIHFASLGRYPDQYVLDWLKLDLAAVGTGKPIVLIQHYDFKVKSREVWWTDAQRKSLADVIRGYKIIAILHGHSHSTSHYIWNGYDMYDDGSLGKNGEIGVLHITDSYFDYANYKVTPDSSGNWTGGSWQWAYRKPR